MSRAFTGGTRQYPDTISVTNTSDVLELLQRFVRDEFPDGSVAEDITEEHRRWIKIAGDDEQEAPMLFSTDGDLRAYGAFVYLASEHSTQVIWKNKFEIRQVDNKWVVNVSDWSGPTVESWERDRGT